MSSLVVIAPALITVLWQPDPGVTTCRAFNGQDHVSPSNDERALRPMVEIRPSDNEPAVLPTVNAHAPPVLMSLLSCQRSNLVSYTATNDRTVPPKVKAGVGPSDEEHPVPPTVTLTQVITRCVSGVSQGPERCPRRSGCYLSQKVHT